MAAVRPFNVSDAGTRRSPSIDERIWDCEGTSASAAVSRMLGADRGLLQLPSSGVSWWTALKLHLSKGTFGREMHFIP